MTEIISELQEIPSLHIEKPKVVVRHGKPDQIFGNFQRNSHFGYVPTDAILVDRDRYQRKLRPSKITKMAHAWNPDKAGVIVVSKRVDGKYYVIDGQHRHQALQLMENYPTHLFCEIFENLTPQQEAQLFHDLDKERDNLTPGAAFKALRGADNPIALGIARAAEMAGYTTDYEKGPAINNLRAFKTLQEIYRRMGEDGLTNILTVLHTAWPNRKEAHSEPMLRGLETFIAKYGSQINGTRLIQVLSAQSPLYIISTARRIQEDLNSVIYASVAQTIRGLYNKKLRYKLPEWS